MYGSSSAAEACLTSASTDATLSWIPHKSSSSRPVSRRDTRAAVNADAAAAIARPERAFRDPGRQRRQRAVPTPAPGSHPPMLTHLDHHPDIADLMGYRIPVADPVRLGDRLAATIARHRPIRLHTIRVRDHRPVLSRMTGLTALRSPRALLLRPRLTRIRRIARWRQRTIPRATTDLALELTDPRHQPEHQIDHHLRIPGDRRPQLFPPHTARFPASNRNPSEPPDDPLNAYPTTTRPPDR